MNTESDLNLAGLLSQAVELATELLHILEEEPRVLTGCEPIEIVAFSQRKEGLAEQLNEIEKRRCDFLTANKLPLNLIALGEELRLNGNVAATNLCNRLQQIAIACMEANRRNGVLVENRLRYTRRALSIITGHASEEDPSLTYPKRRKPPPFRAGI